MKVLFILNHEAYDGSDVTWNALRLAANLLKDKQEVRIFLMSDSVDLARDIYKKPEAYDNDLVEMMKNLITNGAVVKVCGSCMARCGLHKNVPYYEGANKSTMQELTNWVVDSDKVLTF